MLDKISLLVLEDNPDDYYLLNETLASSEKIKFTVYHCETFKEAVECAVNHHIDVAVLDLNLPDSFGLDTYLSFQKQFSDIPVIVMTGDRDAELAIEAMQQGAQDYIFKGDRRSGAVERIIRYAIERNRLITELKVSNQTIQRLNVAVEQSPVSIVITDVDGQIEYVNDKFCRMTGYSKEEAMGRNPRILKSGEVPSKTYDHLWQTISSKQNWRGELCNRKKNGELYWEDASISPVVDCDGKITNFIAVKEDISDKRALEQLKKDMDSIVRHDLKGPLTGIMNLQELLEMKGELNDAQKRLAALVGQAGHTMFNMIESSLDMLKMEKGEYYYRPAHTDLTRILFNLIQENSVAFSEKNLECQLRLNQGNLERNQKLEVMSDASLLYRMLSNLIQNAIEASPEDKQIRVDIHADENEGVGITISNSGAVPEKVRRDFFGKYITFGKTKGTGLGTYSAKLMADVMNYTIRMETSDQEDSTAIWIRIPGELSDQNFNWVI